MDKTVKIFDKQSDMAKLEKLRERKPYRLTKPIFNFLRSMKEKRAMKVGIVSVNKELEIDRFIRSI